MGSPLDLYQRYFVDKSDERLELFELSAREFDVTSALYPGSFCHVTPAFVFPETFFIDTDRRARKFFDDPGLDDFIRQRKQYPAEPQVRFFAADYTKPPLELDGRFDLLISQYAGFISAACKSCLKPGGYLLANNSHGDAGLASIDPDFKFVAAVLRRGEKFTLSRAPLTEYFIPKKELVVTRDLLLKTGRGVGYTRTAFSYFFRYEPRSGAVAPEHIRGETDGRSQQPHRSP